MPVGRLWELTPAVVLQAECLGLCGNGKLDPGEVCDGTVLSNKDGCSEHGLPGGSNEVYCSSECEYNTQYGYG